MATTDSILELLHDHYKESFSLIHRREQRRDRLLLWLFLLFALLILEIQYPVNARGAVGSITVFGNKVDLEEVPLSLLLSATWVVLAATVLKYCQLTTLVERQYVYLHSLEDRISVAVGDDEIYRREGRAYLMEYPRLLNWAWIFYTILFPVAVLAGTGYLYASEVRSLDYGVPAQLFDAIFVISVLVSIVLYRFLPHRRRPADDSYLDVLGESIRDELGTEDADSTPRELLRLYAVLLLAKGENVSAADVHNAWSAWALSREPGHDSIRPFAELDPSTRQMDSPFVGAIERAARRLSHPMGEV